MKCTNQLHCQVDEVLKDFKFFDRHFKHSRSNRRYFCLRAADELLIKFLRLVNQSLLT